MCLDNGPNHEDDLEKVRLVFSRVQITFLSLRYLKNNFFQNQTSQLKIINFHLQLPDQSDGKNGDDSDSDVSDISGLSETAWKSSPGKEALVLQLT